MPAVERQNQLVDQDQVRAYNPDLLESPTSRPMDFRSPGAMNPREVFDVGYAVHRQEEEGKCRKNFNQGYGKLNAIDDEEEYEEGAGEDTNVPSKIQKAREEDVHSIEQSLRKTTLNTAANARQAAEPKERGYGQHSAAIAAAPKQQVRNRKSAFELNLDGATLLSRRGDKGPSGLRE